MFASGLAKGIDEGKVSFKDHDEGEASREETARKLEPRATSSDVHMPKRSSSSNVTMRGTTKKHDDEQGREEIKKVEHEQ